MASKLTVFLSLSLTLLIKKGVLIVLISKYRLWHLSKTNRAIS
nr:MAG TPA: hypothetical protein [Caudoviricetes sp.]